uniref:Uncharacterized protein n=1 Tax=Chromera velia CCMP2878 TaxID=1169474 RepID=A0A0G4HG41_9ALVE|eukprot:Cvel_6724.t1-p1 / transcript=Cvel_6724.t1 / gene=Cvel_6724 / organism=Chromera_velia_CCMP2878 / gene_product=hypothetical protein / transcript_product=hypothetical protein / location=Cvel_scaffold336:26804-27340(-) / protein_length=179 / sequence_SO=supercontig / SO=protein_coding / is_pseudo=false
MFESFFCARDDLAPILAPAPAFPGPNASPNVWMPAKQKGGQRNEEERADQGGKQAGALVRGDVHQRRPGKGRGQGWRPDPGVGPGAKAGASGVTENSERTGQGQLEQAVKRLGPVNICDWQKKPGSGLGPAAHHKGIGQGLRPGPGPMVLQVGRGRRQRSRESGKRLVGENSEELGHEK